MKVEKFVKNGFGLRQLLFAILASFLLISFAGCQVTSGDSSSEEAAVNENEDPFKNGTVCDSFFWGTWVRMDNGKAFEILEKGIKSDSSTYVITKSGEKTFPDDNDPSESKKYIQVQSLGTFKRQSDNVIVNDNIPYFRNGGTNLDYSLKIVGFSDMFSDSIHSSRALSSAISGLKGIGKSKNFSSWQSSGLSGSDGLLNLKAPTINDVQTVTIDTGDSSGSLIVIPDIKVSNTGDYMGTVALVSNDQYNLKITGNVSNKDEGYLYGNNAKTYDMTLTITNISNNKCQTSVCSIEADDPRLSLSSKENLQAFTISTLKGGSTKTLKLTLSFGDMSEAYVDTGIKVTINNPTSKLEWIDYVPLRFYKGLIPITVCAKSPEENDNAALNGFIIYPDGNNQFFAVKNNQSSILFVPTFGSDENKKYKMVFSGATVTSELSDSTEMFYSVASGSSIEKTINLDTSSDVLVDYISYGGENHTEENAWSAESDFIGYLSEGEIDYYTLTADSEEFYAPGAKNFYRVSFESEYGSLPSSFLAAEGSTISSGRLPVLEQEGMSFLGWYAGSSRVNAGQYEVYGDVTLSAKWSLKDYKVQYFLNGGEAGSLDEAKNDSSNPTAYTIKTEETALKAPKRTGYDFKGWYLSSDFSGSAVEKIAGGATGDIKLYAKWTATSYTITYVLNGGTVPAVNDSSNPASYTIEKSVTIKGATREGYAFAGWYKNSDFSGNKVSSINKGSTGALILYARWLKQCTVTYVSDHGTVPADFAAGIIKGETDTFEAAELPEMKAESWFFKGWYASTGSGGSGTKVTAGSYVINGDLVLTAKWVEACTVSYSSEKASGNVPAAIVVEKGTALTEAQLPSLKAEGFRFTGWFIDGTTNKVSSGYSINSYLNLTAGWEEWYGPDDGFVFVESGTFEMGSKNGGGDDERPVHTVTVSEFYISPYEVTQGEYETYCGYTLSSTPNSKYGIGLDYPAYHISWYNTLVYCNLRSIAENLTPCYTINGTTDPKSWPGIKISNGKYCCSYTSSNTTWDSVTCNFMADGYRLPTEAEWEFAAKGGNKSNGYTYSGSDNIDDVAWYVNNSNSMKHQVGTKNKNELDLYDMSGNVAELCWDRKGPYNSKSVTDPIGSTTSTYRAIRGGHYSINASYLRVTEREQIYPYSNDSRSGFRLVRSGKNRILPFTLSYSSSRGNAPSSVILPKGTVLTESYLADLSFDHYDFEGWFADGTKVQAGYVLQSDTELVAQWKASSYKINYVLNGGASGSADQAFNDSDNPASYTIEDTVTLKDARREGYRFAGWYKKADFSGETVSSIDLGSSGEITLYAKWIEMCTISYSSEKAIVPTAISVEKGCLLTVIELPKLKSTGFRMIGWFNGSTKVSAGDTITTSLNLTAHWEEFDGIDDDFVFVESGTFQMGKSADEDDITPHTVTISEFYISPYELTQGEYEELCCYTSKVPSSKYGLGNNYPVYYVSWYDALVYCNLKSMKEGLTPCYTINGGTDPKNWAGIKISSGKYSCSYTDFNNTWDRVTCDFTANGYRLPTEAEWEFAAKGGNKSKGYIYSGSNNVDEIGWYGYNAGNGTYQVGAKAKNELDLYDMSGNVKEWCWDREANYTSASATDPKGASTGSNVRVLRGGTWGSNEYYLNVVVRSSHEPYYRYIDHGFRLVRSTKNRLVPCTVTYSTSYDTAPASATLPKGYKLTAADLPELSYNHYDFLGWYAGSRKLEEGETVDSDLQIEAHWQITSYKITYVLNGGTSGSTDEAFNASENPENYTVEDSVTLEPSTRAGYKFNGWYEKADFSGEAVTSIERGSSGNKTLYANWIKMYTITYSSERGMVPETITIEKDTLLTVKELPQLRFLGYKMTGWYNGSSKISVDTRITNNLNLTAHWEEYDGIDDGFVLVESGQFTMGDCLGGTNVTPMRKVTVSDFYISPYELTQGDYELYCCYKTSFPSAGLGAGVDYPVYFVSWYDVLVYCNLRSIAEGLTPCYTIGGKTDPKEWAGIKTSDGKYCCSYTTNENNSVWDSVTCDFTANGYRLPTEAEWEFAAKGGTKAKGSFKYSGKFEVGEDPKAGKAAWYKENSNSFIHRVGGKIQNYLGLYDMSGNASEWCWDWYAEYDTNSKVDPRGPDTPLSSGFGRVIRGGNYMSTESGVTVAYRTYSYSGNTFNNNLGFRLVRSAPNN